MFSHRGFNQARIASHKRLSHEIDKFSTHMDHTPDNHRLYFEHNPKNSREWAETVGPSMTKLVAYFLEENAEKKALNILSTLKNLSTKHTKEELEAATHTLLEISTNPTISVLKGVLHRRKKRKQQSTRNKQQNNHTDNHGFTRGAAYFGGNKK